VKRQQVLNRLADGIGRLSNPPSVRVAVDGIDAAGKTTLADELGSLLEARGRPVIRASVDGFHRPRSERYQRGAESPEGYYLDAFDYPALCAGLLLPSGRWDLAGMCEPSLTCTPITPSVCLRKRPQIMPCWCWMGSSSCAQNCWRSGTFACGWRSSSMWRWCGRDSVMWGSSALQWPSRTAIALATFRGSVSISKRSIHVNEPMLLWTIPIQHSLSCPFVKEDEGTLSTLVQ
jgi:hypothetical protein